MFAATSVSHSADMDPIYVEEPVTTPVEFGSGWYLRGDLGYSSHGPFDTSGTSGNDLDVTPINASVAVGYTVQRLPSRRTRIRLSRLDPASTTPVHPSATEQAPSPRSSARSSADLRPSACEGRDFGENEMWNGLVNGYVDLGKYGGFKPYVGAGIGLVMTSYSGTARPRLREQHDYRRHRHDRLQLRRRPGQ